MEEKTMKGDLQHNRRQSERIPADENICFFDAVSGRHRARLMDLSAEGMLIQTSVSLPLNPLLQIVFFPGKELLSVPARIVRVNKKEGACAAVDLKVACTSAKFTQFVLKRALRGVPE